MMAVRGVATSGLEKLFERVRDNDLDAQLKLGEVSVALCALIAHVGISRAELARRLDWIPSRLTKVLSGEDNLTLKTLVRVLAALNYDFDVVIRKPHEARARQPWERSGVVLKLASKDRSRRERAQLTSKNLSDADFEFSGSLTGPLTCANDSSVSANEPIAA